MGGCKVSFFGYNVLEFVERGEALAEFFHAVLAERLEDPVTGGDAQLLDGGFDGDGVADLVGDGEQFEDGVATLVANTEAVVAADGGVKSGSGEFVKA